MRPFDFLGLPIELAIEILVLASLLHRETFKSLVCVSHAFRALVYEACIPHLPIMLRTRHQYESFSSLLTAQPNIVGRRVRFVWFAETETRSSRALGLSIFQRCPVITHMGCTRGLLDQFLSAPPPFAHHHLIDLTVMANRFSWNDFLRKPSARCLFSQLTHFRTNLQYSFVAPDFCFMSLTHIAYAHRTRDFGELPCFDPVNFPVLQQILPTATHKAVRGLDLRELWDTGIKVDPRVNVFIYPAGWQLSDVWEESRLGEKDVWARALSEEYREKMHTAWASSLGPGHRQQPPLYSQAWGVVISSSGDFLD
jgi:hypothetical protein